MKLYTLSQRTKEGYREIVVPSFTRLSSSFKCSLEHCITTQKSKWCSVTKSKFSKIKKAEKNSISAWTRWCFAWNVKIKKFRWQITLHFRAQLHCKSDTRIFKLHCNTSIRCRCSVTCPVMIRLFKAGLRCSESVNLVSDWLKNHWTNQNVSTQHQFGTPIIIYLNKPKLRQFTIS